METQVEKLIMQIKALLIAKATWFNELMTTPDEANHRGPAAEGIDDGGEPDKGSKRRCDKDIMH